MTSQKHTPPVWALFLVMLPPAAAYHYPELFDWRFAAMALPACAAGAAITRKLTILAPVRGKRVLLLARPWFAVWAGYAIAIAAPGLLFRLLAGGFAAPANWTPLWPGGDVALLGPVATVTDALLLPTVPAALAALGAPPRTGPSRPADRNGAEDSATAAPARSAVRPSGLFAATVRAAGPPGLFAAAALALSLRIPGGSLLADRGDVMLNVWNHWWFKKALFDPALSVIHTDYIYQLSGVSLLWHTLGPLNCVMGIVYQAVSGAGPVGTYNFVVLISFALMGWGGYLLGRRQGCLWVGLFAGFAIMLCGAHLGQVHEGHLGLANAQWVVFFLLFVLRTFEKGRTVDAAAAGLFWVAAFYTHFYHAIFCGMILGLMLLAAAGRSAAGSRRIRSAAGSVRAALGHRAALFVLTILSALLFWQPSWWRFWVIIVWTAVVIGSARSVGKAFSPRCWWKAAIPLAVFAAAAGPWLALMFLENARQGGALDWGRPPNFYAADLLAYVVPSHGSRGWSLFEFVWSKFAIPGGDGSAFLGAPVIGLAIYGLLRNRKPYWIYMAACFALISLGPKLHILGQTITRSRLPYLALDTVPFLAAGGVAARYALPASASVVMIASAGLAHLMRRAGVWRSAMGAAAVSFIVLLNYPPLFFYDPPRGGSGGHARGGNGNAEALQRAMGDRGGAVAAPHARTGPWPAPGGCRE